MPEHSLCDRHKRSLIYTINKSYQNQGTTK